MIANAYRIWLDNRHHKAKWQCVYFENDSRSWSLIVCKNYCIGIWIFRTVLEWLHFHLIKNVSCERIVNDKEIVFASVLKYIRLHQIPSTQIEFGRYHTATYRVSYFSSSRNWVTVNRFVCLLMVGPNLKMMCICSLVSFLGHMPNLQTKIYNSISNSVTLARLIFQIEYNIVLFSNKKQTLYSASQLVNVSITEFLLLYYATWTG